MSLATIAHLAAAIESLSPDANVKGLAHMIRGLCSEGASIAVAEIPTAPATSPGRRQLALFDGPARPVHDHFDHFVVGDESSRGYTAPERVSRDPSAAALIISPKENQKKTDRATLGADEAAPPWAERIYGQVNAARSSRSLPPLPPSEIVWGGFVDWVVEKRKSWATRSGLQRRYRQWLCRERDLEAEAAIASSKTSTSSPASPYPDFDERAFDESAAAAATELTVRESSRLASGAFPLTRVRPGSTGPPVRAQAVA